MSIFSKCFLSSSTHDQARPVVGRIAFAPPSKAETRVQLNRQEASLGVSSRQIAESVLAPQPDPRHFRIERFETIGRGLIVLVTYPDCRNYEGRKILVFKDLTEHALFAAEVLDPHFIDVAPPGMPVPIARFHPNIEEGWKLARICAASL